MVSAVYQLTCGVSTTLSRLSRGLSAGIGSTANTSRPAAANPPVRSPSTSASSSTTAPREVVTSTAAGLIRATASPPSVPAGPPGSGRDAGALDRAGDRYGGH